MVEEHPFKSIRRERVIILLSDYVFDPLHLPLGSLSNNIFERCTSTRRGLFSLFDGGFAQIFSQIGSITVKKLRNTNCISSRHVKRENTSLPVDVRRSKTSLLKLPIVTSNLVSCRLKRCLSNFEVSSANGSIYK